MVNIVDALISNVVITTDDRNRLIARMSFHTPQLYTHNFLLANPADMQRLNAIMRYTNTYDDITLMKGKRINLVIDPKLRFIGSVSKNKFIPLDAPNFMEVPWLYLKSVLRRFKNSF